MSISPLSKIYIFNKGTPKMKQYVENDVKVKVEMPTDNKSGTKLENQQPTDKKEVHVLFE